MERMSQYNQWLSSNNHPPSGNNKPASGVTQVSPSGKTRLSGGVETSDGLTLGTSTPVPISNPAGMTTTSIVTAGVPGAENIAVSKHLMWCINSNSKLTVVTSLEIHPGANDQVAFQNLRTSWRFWFNLYTISHIKFVKVYAVVPVRKGLVIFFFSII